MINADCFHVLCFHDSSTVRNVPRVTCHLSVPCIFSNPQCHAPSSQLLPGQGQGAVCFTGRRCRGVGECIKRQPLSKIYLLPLKNTRTVVQRLRGSFLSCFHISFLNSSRSNHGLIPIRGGRRAQGIQKVQELEQKVQALEQAIKTDVSTCQV